MAVPNVHYGICHECREHNSYTATNCRYCHTRLAWAFLVDGRDDLYRPPLYERLAL